jgi:glycerol-3-phosphate dehydrogenase
MERIPEPSREETLHALTCERLDVLVMGGGIVGAGVARDAAMRGLRVGLMEQYDFAFGTSSRSSRLLHGGLRYLAQGRLGLVREASREKLILQRIAPHLVQPLAFLFPAYNKRKPRLWQLAAGVKIYDLLCGRAPFEPSRSLDAGSALRRAPGLRADGLRGAVRYYDALTNDSRLVIDTLRGAANHGASVCNYLRAEGVERKPDFWLVRGSDLHGGQSVEISARCVVNATGAWAERFAQTRLRLRPTKGIHAAIERERLPVRDAVAFADGRRLLFAIPWGERVILGTTDTDYGGSPDDVGVNREEIDYLLAAVNDLFPGAGLRTEDVRSAWAGVRPLIADTRGDPSDISRAHAVYTHPSGWIDVAGGKLTTYRLIAEQIVDRTFRFLGRRRGVCATAREPLLDPGEVCLFSSVVPPEPSEEVVWRFCEKEWALHLGDVMIRRSSWQHYRKDAELLASRVAGWMAQALGWGPGRTANEFERYGKEVQSSFRSCSFLS